MLSCGRWREYRDDARAGPGAGCRRRDGACRRGRGRRCRRSASTSADPRPSPSDVVTHAFAATLPGYGGWYWAVSPGPRRATATSRPSTRSCCCPATTRCWPRRGCRGRSGSVPATSARATCCRHRPDDPRLVPGLRATPTTPTVESVALELGSRPGPGDVPRGSPGRRRALVHRRPRPGHLDGPPRPGHLRHLRVLPAAGRRAARRIRRLRQRVHRRPTGRSSASSTAAARTPRPSASHVAGRAGRDRL